MAIGDPVVPDNRNGMPGRHATRVSVIADATYHYVVPAHGVTM